MFTMPSFKNSDLKSLIFIFFPISLVVGSALVNILLVTTSIYFIYWSNKNKINFLILFWVKIFFLFIIYVCLLSFFAEDYLSSLRSSISLSRFILFSLFIYTLDLNSKFKLYKNLYTTIIILVCVDVNIQYISGYDIFGYPAEGYRYANYEAFSHWKNENVHVGRLSGPFKDELIPGAFISGLSIPLIFYYFGTFKSNKLTKNILNILATCIFLQSTLITGERLSSILMVSSIFFSIIIFFNYKQSLITILILILIIIFSFSKNSFIKARWIDTYDIILNLNKSSYGRIYHSSFTLWNNKKLFGHGLKNYRIKCNDLDDPNPENVYPYCSSTHPHNIYFELLSETGLIGTLLYLFFLFNIFLFLSRNKKYKFNKNIFYFGAGSVFYLLFKLIPLPSGSIFSTWNASIFWFHLGISLNFICKDLFNKYKK